MDEHESLAVRFDEYRPHLKAVAYRMLGSLADGVNRSSSAPADG
jgi:DNA-directed RNA polymerase specialized sigma24 family protein